MPIDNVSDDRLFLHQVERQLGRHLNPDEAELAITLRPDKSAALIARELDGAVIADPKKIRPEHSDTANE